MAWGTLRLDDDGTRVTYEQGWYLVRTADVRYGHLGPNPALILMVAIISKVEIYAVDRGFMKFHGHFLLPPHYREVPLWLNAKMSRLRATAEALRYVGYTGRMDDPLHVASLRRDLKGKSFVAICYHETRKKKPDGRANDLFRVPLADWAPSGNFRNDFRLQNEKKQDLALSLEYEEKAFDFDAHEAEARGIRIERVPSDPRVQEEAQVKLGRAVNKGGGV